VNDTEVSDVLRTQLMQRLTVATGNCFDQASFTNKVGEKWKINHVQRHITLHKEYPNSRVYFLAALHKECSAAYTHTSFAYNSSFATTVVSCHKFTTSDDKRHRKISA